MSEIVFDNWHIVYSTKKILYLTTHTIFTTLNRATLTYENPEKKTASEKSDFHLLKISMHSPKATHEILAIILMI